MRVLKMISVKIDSEPFLTYLSQVPDKVKDSVKDALKDITKDIQDYARSHHRFKRQTGALQDSVQTYVGEMTGEVFLDPSIADYGIYVHEGHGSWDPDRFLDEAIDSKENEIIEKLNQAVEYGLSQI
jgi:hypothetical protein